MFNNFNIKMVDYKIAAHFKLWATKSGVPFVVKVSNLTVEVVQMPNRYLV